MSQVIFIERHCAVQNGKTSPNYLNCLEWARKKGADPKPTPFIYRDCHD